MTIERPDRPHSADEVGMLRGFLDHYRATIRLQAGGLDDAQLAVGHRTLGRRPGLGLAQRVG